MFKMNNEQLDSEVGEAEYQEYKKYIEEPILVCDDCGIAIIPLAKQTENFLKKLDFIELQEDQWFSEIDSGNDTFDTVCLQSYREGKDKYEYFRIDLDE